MHIMVQEEKDSKTGQGKRGRDNANQRTRLMGVDAGVGFTDKIPEPFHV
jgi:hypothetical protein